MNVRLKQPPAALLQRSTWTVTPEKLNSECRSFVTCVSTVCASASSPEETNKLTFIQTQAFLLAVRRRPHQPTRSHVHGQQRLRRVEAPNVQAVNVRDSSDGQQLLSHAVDANLPRGSCREASLGNSGKPSRAAGKASVPSISILRTSLVTGKVVPRTRTENRRVQIGSTTL